MKRAQTNIDAIAMFITQATTATFSDLYFQHTFLFFIQAGKKYVGCSVNGELLGQETDLLVFPAGSTVLMENRPVLDADYQALGICLSDDLVRQAFSNHDAPTKTGVQRVVEKDGRLERLKAIITDTVCDHDLPTEIRQHRLIEVLIWLKQFGVKISPQQDQSPIGRVRLLIETDLSRPWRAKDVAEHFAMSEATMRRWLQDAGQSFSKILQYTRLEHGLTLLQTTPSPISQIALEIGFKTPSHFTDAFHQRFGITPSQIRHRES
ncbi:MAG: hypothetical protein Hens3KO_20300 [Henriciella sp.]